MVLVKWDDSYSLDIRQIDDQHKIIFHLINGLHQTIEQANPRAIQRQALIALENYTVEHFRHEEELMEEFKYPDLPAHREQHANFISKLHEFKESYEQEEFTLSKDMVRFLVDWLILHIHGTDKKYSRCFLDNGIT